MKPRDSQAKSLQDNLFQACLDQQLDPKHPLFRLAQQIDWSYFEQEFGSFYSEEMGRPGAPTRLLVGLHYLKHAYDESDESVVEKWVENPYWQYFCGYEYFQHELPCHPTSLVKWRQRIKADCDLSHNVSHGDTLCDKSQSALCYGIFSHASFWEPEPIHSLGRFRYARKLVVSSRD